jgi:hypothetical protein
MGIGVVIERSVLSAGCLVFRRVLLVREAICGSEERRLK